jgi:hypothetical protein
MLQYNFIRGRYIHWRIIDNLGKNLGMLTNRQII